MLLDDVHQELKVISNELKENIKHTLMYEDIITAKKLMYLREGVDAAIEVVKKFKKLEN